LTRFVTFQPSAQQKSKLDSLEEMDELALALSGSSQRRGRMVGTSVFVAIGGTHGCADAIRIELRPKPGSVT